MLITLEMAKESPYGMKMVTANLNLNSPKHCFLTTYILQERINPNTKWQKYIDILPKSYENFPIFFNDDEKKLLQGSPFLSNSILSPDQVNEKIADIKEDYNMILKVS
jgi:histone-lysine N-methyltransferase SETD3